MGVALQWPPARPLLLASLWWTPVIGREGRVTAAEGRRPCPSQWEGGSEVGREALPGPPPQVAPPGPPHPSPPPFILHLIFERFAAHYSSDVRATLPIVQVGKQA